MNIQKTSIKAVSSTKSINNANPHALLRLLIESNKQTVLYIVITLGLIFFGKALLPQKTINSIHTYSGHRLNIVD